MVRRLIPISSLALLALVVAGCGLGRADLTQKAPYGPSHSRSVPMLVDEQPAGMYTVLAVYQDSRPRERPSTMGLEGVARDIGADAILASKTYSHTERRKIPLGRASSTSISSFAALLFPVLRNAGSWMTPT